MQFSAHMLFSTPTTRAAVDQGTDIPEHSSQFVQYAADNVDHNIRTLDGNNTFHGMASLPWLHQVPHKTTLFLDHRSPLPTWPAQDSSKYSITEKTTGPLLI